MNLFIEGSGDKTIVVMSGAGVPSPVLEYKPLADRLSGRYRVVIIEKFGYGYHCRSYRRRSRMEAVRI